MDLQKARAWALVLDAEGIPYQLTPDEDGGWQLAVAPSDAERTGAALSAYEAENFDAGEIGTTAASGAGPHAGAGVAKTGVNRGAIAVGLGAAVALALLYTVTGPRDGASAWFARGALDGAAFGAGEVWRAVTALTLHADVPHVLANMFSGALFFTAVCAVAGPGVGLLAIVAAGALGNAANAMLHGPGYSGVGASTAVFGAVGILAGAQFARLRWPARGRWPWRPVLAGVLLLAMLGFGPETDVLAHVLGFAAGLIVGGGVRLVNARPVGAGVQWALVGLAAMVVAGAWWRAWQ